MKKLYLLISFFVIMLSCTNSRKSQVSSDNVIRQKADSLESQLPSEEYHATTARIIDILHTKLEVSFDWEKQYMNGKATITFKPYFYPVKEITLDAKSFDVKEVSLLASSGKNLPFTYNKTQLTITFDKEYTRSDTLKIFIDYVAKPNERETKIGDAVTSDKGLYFINPMGKEKNKPIEIWTQGEPESNSCWFPTLDKPNERMTQEIYITVDSTHKNFVTLSNGLLLSSKKNPDGSRTDYWKQSLPAAPYLSMMAIGDFAIVKDTWRNKDVNYYVEHEFESYAKAIFGHTPEMLEFFSTKLGTTYPWEKFSQIVVRDYVSGAMENTTAVLHGEFLNRTDREMLDKNYEDVISHELFHQWFGDYVTCEAWSNTTLNEGFATYGEYLWQEYKYGRDAADHHGYKSMQGYISSQERSPKHLIRYYYNELDNMFDANSYNKGGAVLHMLRKYVGDDAFFTVLKIYLDKNKFSSVEADDLRLVFEQVTGEDLHWFFDQWFFGEGYPKLLIQHNYNDMLKKYTVRIRQTQDLSSFPVFKLPIDIDIYVDGKKERKRVWTKNEIEDFSFDVAKKPDMVNVDADKSLVCTKEEKKSVQEWVFQYRNGPLYLDRKEALKELSVFATTPEAADVIVASLSDKFWEIRETAIGYIEKLPQEYRKAVKEKIIVLAKNDDKSSVRTLAIEQLDNNYKDEDLTAVYRQCVNDQSYAVAGASLIALAKSDKKESMRIAKQFESEKSMDMLLTVAQIYSQYGSDVNNSFFIDIAPKMSGWDKVSFAMNYTDFLKLCSDSTINAGILVLENIVKTENNRWIRYFGQKGIKDLAQMYADKEHKVSEQIALLKETKSDSPELRTLEQALTQIQGQKQKLTVLYNSMVTVN
ncbi:MAG: M1 family metallopeptidase [Bacteroidetes bacterium]|nr:M1 family metallopeptidase [Bacteroidota bacterium]